MRQIGVQCVEIMVSVVRGSEGAGSATITIVSWDLSFLVRTVLAQVDHHVFSTEQ